MKNILVFLAVVIVGMLIAAAPVITIVSLDHSSARQLQTHLLQLEQRAAAEKQHVVNLESQRTAKAKTVQRPHYHSYGGWLDNQSVEETDRLCRDDLNCGLGGDLKDKWLYDHPDKDADYFVAHVAGVDNRKNHPEYYHAQITGYYAYPNGISSAPTGNQTTDTPMQDLQYLRGGYPVMPSD